MKEVIKDFFLTLGKALGVLLFMMALGFEMKLIAAHCPDVHDWMPGILLGWVISSLATLIACIGSFCKNAWKWWQALIVIILYWSMSYIIGLLITKALGINSAFLPAIGLGFLVSVFVIGFLTILLTCLWLAIMFLLAYWAQIRHYGFTEGCKEILTDLAKPLAYITAAIIFILILKLLL